MWSPKSVSPFTSLPSCSLICSKCKHFLSGRLQDSTGSGLEDQKEEQAQKTKEKGPGKENSSCYCVLEEQREVGPSSLLLLLEQASGMPRFRR